MFKKYTAKWGVQITGMFFLTRSNVLISFFLEQSC
ncbi:DUF6783 domain-containing protein [Blautia sp. HCP3S3_D9]